MRKAGFSWDELAKALHRSSGTCKDKWTQIRPRDAGGIASSDDDLRPNLSDTDFNHIAEMRQSLTSWNVIQQSRWPDFDHRRVREAYEKAALRRVSEINSRPRSEQLAPRREISDADLVLIKRMREEGDMWATISCTLDPKTPHPYIDRPVNWRIEKEKIRGTKDPGKKFELLPANMSEVHKLRDAGKTWKQIADAKYPGTHSLVLRRRFLKQSEAAQRGVRDEC
jgi:hypothetical protein